MNPLDRQNILFTNKARCRNCYRCLRMCPVKAIRIKDGQAYVDNQRCLGCGTCLRECPQGAKTYRNDVDRVIQLIQQGKQVAVSLAPSYASIYADWEQRRIASALRRLGVTWVEETALGAEYTACETARVLKENTGQPVICSACPAVVHYIESYQPVLLPYLAPVVSPMIAHARMMKQRYGSGCSIVFIGPCLAKKMEAERPEYQGVVEAVLTFAELEQWLQQEGVQLNELEESWPDQFSNSASRYFPLVGGLAKTAQLSTDLLDTEVAAVSGFDGVKAVLDAILKNPRSLLVEPLFCNEGCIHGAGISRTQNLFENRHRLIEFARRTHPWPATMLVSAPMVVEMHTHYQAKLLLTEFSEVEIQRMLEQTGKALLEDQLNCGACGYNSCRDKVIAVLAGMAEPEMCIPQMIRVAERRTDKIIETTPNGIVILNQKLEIIGMNRAFRRMFQCTDTLLGKPIAYLFDPVGFEKLAAAAESNIEGRVSFSNYNLICHQILYPLKDEQQYVGIYVNLTHAEDAELSLKTLKQETIRQSQELLEHQVHMAQELVRFLGENTAKAESLVKKITQLALSDHV